MRQGRLELGARLLGATETPRRRRHGFDLCVHRKDAFDRATLAVGPGTEWEGAWRGETRLSLAEEVELARE